MKILSVKPIGILAPLAVLIYLAPCVTALPQPSIAGSVSFTDGSIDLNSSSLQTATNALGITADIGGGSGTYAGLSPFFESAGWNVIPGAPVSFEPGPQVITNFWALTNGGTNYSFNLGYISQYLVQGSDQGATLNGSGTLFVSGYSPTPGTFSLAIEDGSGGTSGQTTFDFSATFTAQTLTNPTVTWTNPSPITYGAPLTVTQLDATASVAGSFVYTPASGTVLNSGANTLSVTFTPTNTNYADITTNVSLTVLKAPLTVTAANASRPVGQPNPIFTGTIVGVTNGDNITASYSCSATTNSAAGTYSIVPSLVDPNNRQTNYTVILNNGTLTVFSAPYILSVNIAGGFVNLTWSAISNDVYQVQTGQTLGNWHNLGGTNAATNSTMTAAEPYNANPQQYYRVLLIP